MSLEQINTYSKKAPMPILAEVIGPIDHLIAGFIPAGLKITQVGQKKWYYFRQVEGQWIHYGNGKDPWYTLSWEAAGTYLRDCNKKNIMPLGAGGLLHPPYGDEIEQDVLTDNSNIEDMEEADIL